MAQQIVGADGTTIVKIDPTFGAMRVTPRPLEATAWLQVSGRSNLMTGVVANGPIFSLRNASANLMLIRKVQIGFITSTGFTAAQYLDFNLLVARSWTAADSAGATGAAITLTGNNCKLRTSLSALTSAAAFITTTGIITAGTRVVDSNAIGNYGQWFTAAGAGIGFGLTTIFDQGPGDYPLVCANNEGIVIQVGATAMGAAGVGYFTVMVEVAETTTALFV
jgi:hypothetical protein